VVLSYVVAALAAGFPIVITLAWVFDVKAGRIERTAPAPAATGLRGIRLGLLLVGIGVLSAAPGLFYYFVVRGGGRSLSTEVSNSASNASSIAVLPFLSAGEENAYFAQGFHDELLRQLGRIGDLRVISRTSVMQYKDGARNSREIAEALGVSSIVEGSVQRAGNRVRVEARLIDARNDRQTWGDRYDRDVTDIFAIQTAVAEEIARTLQARISPSQKAEIERKPTQSAEAYDLYLRGLEYANRPGRLPSNFAVAERFYRQAIKTDQSFALAWARLAFVKVWTYWSVAGTPDRVAQEAQEAAEQSLRIQPDLPEGHLALGLYHYWRDREYENALKELEIARAGIPAEAAHYVGMVLRRHGKFDEGIRNQEEALRLDPRSLLIRFELTESFIFTRRYKEAEQALDRVLALAPDFPGASLTRAIIYEAWKGDTSLAKGALMENRGRLDPGGQLGVAQSYIVTLLEHHPREALSFLDSLQSDSLIDGPMSIPKAFLYAVAHEAIGDTARATKEYETALRSLQARVDENAGRAAQRSLVARAYAGLGRKEAALREARRAVESLPISKDHLLGSDIEIERALVEARVGETDAAIEHIRYLLSIPCQLSPGLLRVDPKWAPLRGDPRFRKLAELEQE
jgi:TolB-like protein/tetratricopeptide (TPR) repeat protein